MKGETKRRVQNMKQITGTKLGSTEQTIVFEALKMNTTFTELDMNSKEEGKTDKENRMK